MKTEQEFESRVKELGRLGIKKRQQRITRISTITGAVAIFLIAITIVWRMGVLEPIKPSMEPSYNLSPEVASSAAAGMDEMQAEDKYDNLSGVLKPNAGVHDVVDADATMSNVDALLKGWFDTLDLDMLEKIDAPEEGDAIWFKAGTENATEVCVKGQSLCVDGNWYRLTDADLKSLEEILHMD